MKIIQYNIYFGDHDNISLNDRMKNLKQVLLSEDADVICLQEVVKDSFDYLCALLKSEYPNVYPHQDDGLDQPYGTVIFSKNPFKKAIRHKFEFTTMGRDVKIVLIERDNEKVYICTTHFESEFKNDCMKKIYQYKRCADILHQIYKKTKIPVILCSDTNVCKISDDAFNETFVHSKGWRDAWIENGSDTKNGLTFDSETNPILIKRYTESKTVYKGRIDRILHLSDLHAINFRLIGTGQDPVISDHYGLVCTFTKDKPADRPDYALSTVNNKTKRKSVKSLKILPKLF